MWNLSDKLNAIRTENKAWEEEFRLLMEFQNNGMKYEKEGNLILAIESYEQGIKFGRDSKRMRINNFFHSISRLAVVYRKLKRYEDEIRVVEDSLKLDELMPKDRDKLEQRLIKAKLLQEKVSR